MVYPRAQLNLRGASIWMFEGGGLARIGIADTNTIRCPLEWYREYSEINAGQEDYPGANTRVACASAQTLFRTGFKYEAHERALNFRINAVELDAGLTEDMILSLPFEGNIPDHEDEPREDTGCTQGFGKLPFRIAIDLMEIEGNALRIVVRTGNSQTALEFDVAPLSIQRGDRRE